MQQLSHLASKQLTHFRSFAKSFRSADLCNPLTEFSQHLSYRFNCKFYTFTPKKNGKDNRISPQRVSNKLSSHQKLDPCSLTKSKNGKTQNEGLGDTYLDCDVKQATPLKEGRSDKVESTAAKNKIISEEKILEENQKSNYKFFNFQDASKNNWENQVEEEKHFKKEKFSKKIRKISRIPLVDRFNRKIYYTIGNNMPISMMNFKI